MAFQARDRAHGSSADHIYTYRSILLTVAFTDVVSSDAPRLMRSEKIKAAQKFEEILQRFEIPLLQYATRITGDRERARDVVQETFIKFQRNGSLDREDKAATWLFTVCRNRALNVCRKERRMMYLHEDTLESQERSPANALQAHRGGRGHWVPHANYCHPAAASTGGATAEISKRSQLQANC